MQLYRPLALLSLSLVLFTAPGTSYAQDSEPAARCAPYVPFAATPEELEAAGFHPGGVRPFLLAFLAGPRIAMEWNDGRKVRPIEMLRAIPYLGNLVGLYLCREALSGYRMTTVAGEAQLDERRRSIYFKRIAALERGNQFAQAALMRECSPFDTYTHPANPQALKPDESKGFAKWKSGMAGLLIDNRIGLEREESRAIRRIEYWSILRLPLIVPAVKAWQGETMSEVVRREHLDEAWLAAESSDSNVEVSR